LLGRWIYAEAELSVPGMVPHIDAALETVAIPTHDRWTAENMAEMRELVAAMFERAKQVPQAYAEERAMIDPKVRRMADGYTLWGSQQ
jgi:hypothetical protein